MPIDTKSAGWRVAVGSVAVTVAVAGCMPNKSEVTSAPTGTASAAVAPPPSSPAAGQTRALAGVPVAAVIDPASKDLVVLTGPGGSANTVTVLGRGTERTIALPAGATALAGDGPGRVVASTRGGYLSVDLAAGTATRTDIAGRHDTDFTAIGRRGDGRLVLGGADGSVFVLGSPTTVEYQDKPVSRVDSLVTQGDTTIVLDRAQTSVTAVTTEGAAKQSLRAGEGATTMAIDAAGRVLVADTRGEELLVFGANPLILRQRYPVREAPYGVTGSPGLVWVSQTAANAVIGYDLATGIPVEKVRYPTVQQPNLLAFDDASQTLYVVSGSGAGVQVIEHAGPPR